MNYYYNSFRSLRILTLGLSLALGFATALPAEETLVPFIDGEWTPIAGNPDLGDLTGPTQQPVDFAVWQAKDGTWQAASCIRRTKCGGNTRLFYRWEGKNLTDANWEPKGILMQSDPELGEIKGGLQAPHVIQEGGLYHMFYGDWNSICHATSEDGKTFTRVVQPSGKTAMFTEGVGMNTRDVVMLKIDDTWFAYYTAYPNGQGVVYVRTTKDFKTWSDAKAVAYGGSAGTNPYSSECPHVIAKHGYYYLFKTQKYGPTNISRVYRSKDPYYFGVNQDDMYLMRSLPVAAPEIVSHEGQDYIVALNEGLDGLRIAKLGWKAPPKVGKAVLSPDASSKADWKIESGDLDSALTNSKRSHFGQPSEYFVGSAEIGKKGPDDKRKGVVRSPEFTIPTTECFAYISGGSDIKKLYCAIFDAKSNEELLRFTSPTSDSNVLMPMLLDTNKVKGKQVYLKVVDDATGPWGHINFGGLYVAE